MILKINDLRVRSVVGVHDWEKKSPRELTLQVEVEYDCPRAAESDELEDTLNYSKLNGDIIAFVEANNFQLIEKLAVEVARLCLLEKRAKSAKVEVDKPGALRYARSVSVSCRLEKDSP